MHNDDRVHAEEYFKQRGIPSMIALNISYITFHIMFLTSTVLIFIAIINKLKNLPYQWRITVQRYRYATLGLIGVSFVPYTYIGFSVSSDQIALASLLVSLIVGIMPNLIGRLDTRLRIYIAIPSTRPFNQAIRNGLFSTLARAGVQHTVNDPYGTQPGFEERQGQLVSQIAGALDQPNDIVIIHPGTKNAANDDLFLHRIEQLQRRGSILFIIENFPDKLIPELSSHPHGHSPTLLQRSFRWLGFRPKLLRKIYWVRSDSESGATLLANHILYQFPLIRTHVPIRAVRWT
jgi:hypothetical protein